LELPLVQPITVGALKIANWRNAATSGKMMFAERELLCAINQVIGEDTPDCACRRRGGVLSPRHGG